MEQISLVTFSNLSDEEPDDATTVPSEPADAANNAKPPPDEKTSILKNVYWKEFGLLAFVWMAFLALQIAKNYTSSCSMLYWVLNSLQIPVSLGVSMHEAHGLISGKRVLSSKGISQHGILTHRQLFVYCLFGILAGLVGGLLGLGGGFIMGPLFLELGIPPQVSSATSTFAMISHHPCRSLSTTSCTGFQCPMPHTSLLLHSLLLSLASTA